MATTIQNMLQNWGVLSGSVHDHFALCCESWMCTRARSLYIHVRMVQTMVQSCQDIPCGMYTLGGYGCLVTVPAHMSRLLVTLTITRAHGPHSPPYPRIDGHRPAFWYTCVHHARTRLIMPMSCPTRTHRTWTDCDKPDTPCRPQVGHVGPGDV